MASQGGRVNAIVFEEKGMVPEKIEIVGEVEASSVAGRPEPGTQQEQPGEASIPATKCGNGTGEKKRTFHKQCNSPNHMFLAWKSHNAFLCLKNTKSYMMLCSDQLVIETTGNCLATIEFTKPHVSGLEISKCFSGPEDTKSDIMLFSDQLLMKASGNCLATKEFTKPHISGLETYFCVLLVKSNSLSDNMLSKCFSGPENTKSDMMLFSDQLVMETRGHCLATKQVTKPHVSGLEISKCFSGPENTKSDMMLFSDQLVMKTRGNCLVTIEFTKPHVSGLEISKCFSGPENTKSDMMLFSDQLVMETRGNCLATIEFTQPHVPGLETCF
ncbi:hypothetical protein ABVT39_010204 [Epinephelus coioides]